MQTLRAIEKSRKKTKLWVIWCLCLTRPLYESHLITREEFEKEFGSTWDEKELVDQLWNEYIVGVGVIAVEPSDRWLVLFDPNSKGWSDVLVIHAHDDLDDVVKQRCLKDREPDPEEALGVWRVPEGPLDWSGNTTYHCVRSRYKWDCDARLQDARLGPGCGITRVSLLDKAGLI